MLAPSLRPELNDELPADREPASRSAQWLGICLKSWHRWRLDPLNPLPAFRIGGRWYASRSEVLDWIDRRSRPRRNGEVAATADLSTSPPYSRRRQAEIQAAIRACEARGC